MSKYEKNVYLAMLAEQCNRFEEMVEFLEDLLKSRKDDLNADERNLLSIAYKNSVTSKRSALRTVMAYENKESKKTNSNFLPFIQEYRKKIDEELEKTCKGVIQAIDTHLLPRAGDDEAKVFYHKMKGDYNRYIAEFSQGDAREVVANAAADAYQMATECAKKLSPIHPIVLGLALNYSVFFFEIFNNHEKAIEIAQETLNVAQKELPNVEDEDNDECRDAISIINLLRENLEMWKIDTEDN